MNRIFNTSRTKRKYRRKPGCPNKFGNCMFYKCYCKIGFTKQKKAGKITEEVIHREKAVARKRQIELQKLDNAILPGVTTIGVWNWDYEKPSLWSRVKTFLNSLLP